MSKTSRRVLAAREKGGIALCFSSRFRLRLLCSALALLAFSPFSRARGPWTGLGPHLAHSVSRRKRCITTCASLFLHSLLLAETNCSRVLQPFRGEGRTRASVQRTRIHRQVIHFRWKYAYIAGSIILNNIDALCSFMRKTEIINLTRKSLDQIRMNIS